jgi:hypothetical protein
MIEQIARQFITAHRLTFEVARKLCESTYGKNYFGNPGQWVEIGLLRESFDVFCAELPAAQQNLLLKSDDLVNLSGLRYEKVQNVASYLMRVVLAKAVWDMVESDYNRPLRKQPETAVPA